MKRVWMAVALLGVSALAADSKEQRLLKFASDTYKGDVRNGPYTFTGTEKEPVQAQVSNLKISSLSAVFSAPAGKAMTEAAGSRTAEFTNTVKVNRGRLSAEGPSLTYSEETGVGTLKGPATSVFAPEKEGDDPVNVKANQMAFDVDTNISTSTGKVSLVTGRQTGTSDKLVFDEKKELGILTGSVQLIKNPKDSKDNKLTITGTEARVLTNEKKKLLLVKGTVKLVDGDITTTGNTVYYDDKANRAIVIGSPAKSYNAKNKTTISGGTLEQNTDKNTVRLFKGNVEFSETQFK
ncbi:LptA/OstA family protein [Deinococcus cellulosilyticus]|uniref:Organic solvent tolerance-like N-terminal domain-containing protein n=1 Tax=Deinococcus cellulosilyticus (strain DSM 18568 / NBRC 106333 / KACC 11606 / 5516J-15) TaxID=1223518 RepID=A0A511N5G6_DEIC1|nr:LptA/OstA family protein [Deinococcus cellulosilyticus]GEM48102.1 hypothetical protein DC3_37370 [Deinococcus cellulosilyticus NBRC 106333 = KACC 11606]